MKNVVQDLTSAGIDWQREKWQSGLGSKFIHQGEKNAAKYADEVIVLSKEAQNYFKETYGKLKVVANLFLVSIFVEMAFEVWLGSQLTWIMLLMIYKMKCMESEKILSC